MRLFKKSLMVLGLSVSAITMLAGQALAVSDVEQGIIDKLQQVLPNVPVVGVKPSPVEGLYEVTLGNGERVFLTSKADYFVAGDMFKFATGGVVNLTDAQRLIDRAELLAGIDPSKKITYTPENKKASITVFTDIDCGYCQKLHSEMDTYMQAGIEVNYLAFPRDGIGSPAFHKIESAWCADDKNDALTRLKAGQSVESKSCDSPVAEQYNLALEFGIRGTPAIVFESGKIVQGYRPASMLADFLGI